MLLSLEVIDCALPKPFSGSGSVFALMTLIILLYSSAISAWNLIDFAPAVSLIISNYCSLNQGSGNVSLAEVLTIFFWHLRLVQH